MQNEEFPKKWQSITVPPKAYEKYMRSSLKDLMLFFAEYGIYINIIPHYDRVFLGTIYANDHNEPLIVEENYCDCYMAAIQNAFALLEKKLDMQK